MTTAGFYWGVGFWLALLAVAFAVLFVVLVINGIGEAIVWAARFLNGKALDLVMAPRLKRWRADPRHDDLWLHGKPIRGWRNRSFPWDPAECSAYIREHGR